MKKKKYLVFVLLFAMVFSSIGLGYYLATNKQDNLLISDDQDAELGIIPGMSREEIQEKLNMVVAKGMTNISINTNPIFAHANSEGNLRIQNIAANHYAYIVTIRLDSNNEMIYESGRIKPGYYVENAKLDKRLPKGEYLATATFVSYTIDTNKEVGAVAVKMKIDIQN